MAWAQNALEIEPFHLTEQHFVSDLSAHCTLWWPKKQMCTWGRAVEYESSILELWEIQNNICLRECSYITLNLTLPGTGSYSGMLVYTCEQKMSKNSSPFVQEHVMPILPVLESNKTLVFRRESMLPNSAVSRVTFYFWKSSTIIKSLLDRIVIVRHALVKHV